MTNRDKNQPTRTGLSNAALGALIALIPVAIFIGYFLISM